VTRGPPENFNTKGIETTTGPWAGHATSVGSRWRKKPAPDFGKKARRAPTTYVLASDGGHDAGVSQEAIALPGTGGSTS